MFKRFPSRRRRPLPRDAIHIADPRPYRRRPGPQPRMRWY